MNLLWFLKISCKRFKVFLVLTLILIIDLWNLIEEKFETLLVTFSLVEQMSLCIEAWNAALTVTFLKKNKSWKSIISKQIRSAKKNLSKFRTLLEMESMEKMKSRFSCVDISLNVSFIDIVKI